MLNQKVCLPRNESVPGKGPFPHQTLVSFFTGVLDISSFSYDLVASFQCYPSSSERTKRIFIMSFIIEVVTRGVIWMSSPQVVLLNFILVPSFVILINVLQQFVCPVSYPMSSFFETEAHNGRFDADTAVVLASRWIPSSRCVSLPPLGGKYALLREGPIQVPLRMPGQGDLRI